MKIKLEMHDKFFRNFYYKKCALYGCINYISDRVIFGDTSQKKKKKTLVTLLKQ